MPVEVTDLTETVPRNGDASITIKTAPGASCFISVEYATGESEAAGLDEETANADGVASWEWTVGGKTEPGTWPITVACGLPGKFGRVATSFTVT